MSSPRTACNILQARHALTGKGAATLKTINIHTLHLPIFALFSTALLSACSFQSYSAKPIDPVQSVQHYRAHDPVSAEFHSYAIAQGYPADRLPIQQWGLRELTLSALFFHPQLDIARADLQASRAREISAGQRPNPTLSGSRGKSEDEVSPWIYSIGIDMPIQTAGKRQASIEQAVSLSEAARIEIGQSAWQVRNRLLNSWIEYNAAVHMREILQQELDLRSEIIDMLDARFEAGMISSVDSSNARLQLQKTQQSLATEKGRIPQLRAALASNAGLAPESFARIDLATRNLDEIAATPHHTMVAREGSDALQDAALLNRLDIRAALARYDAAEKRLRLEVARQYPDITLSPSHIYEEGFHIWSLGLAALLPLLNQNDGLIAEANALREVEAAQFEALQAKIIGDMEQARARYYAAIDTLELARQVKSAHQARLGQITQQFTDGYVDRLELATAKLENLAAMQNLLAAEYDVQRAAAALEDVLQRPLEEMHSVPGNMQQAVTR